ncbi:MAG: hypothetical protein EOP62_22140 [Sphingomonadales bacterium]|nr:MAG: hypothetical protein EOP62_22140 [Sphingomonadales bacterium]
MSANHGDGTRILVTGVAGFIGMALVEHLLARESIPFKVSDRADHPMSLSAATKKSDELMSETYAHLYRLPLTGLRFVTV